MKRYAVLIALLIVVVAIGLALSGCLLPTGKTGSLKISADSVQAKNLVPTEGGTIGAPAISLDVVAYLVTLRTASETGSIILGPAALVEGGHYAGLTPGVYWVGLVGINATGIPLGTGGAPVEVYAGTDSPVQITVSEIGNGFLHVSTTWAAGRIVNPCITSTLSYGGAALADPVWTLGTGSPATSATDSETLAAGWYGMSMSVWDTGAPAPSAGWATLVRIAVNQTTRGLFDLSPNATPGGFAVDIIPDYFDAIALTLTSDPVVDTVYYEGSSDQTITASGADVYAWYLDGVAVDASETHVFSGVNFPAGTHHRVDCLGFTARGAGELSWNIESMVTQPDQFEIEGTCKNTNTGFYDAWTLTLCDADTLDVVRTVTIPGAEYGTLRPFSIPAAPGGSYKICVRADPTHAFWYGPTIVLPHAGPGPLVLAVTGNLG